MSVQHTKTILGVALLGLGLGLVVSPLIHTEEAQALKPVPRIAKDSKIIPVKGSPVMGDELAPVTIVVFGDFQCPFCDRGAQTIKQIYEAYPGKVRLVFKHFPLAFHQQAKQAAWASVAADKQGSFWPMHDKLYANFKTFKEHSSDMDSYMEQLAADLGLDLERFKKDYADASLRKRVDEDMELGAKLGVRGTPHFFVNGVRVSGAQPFNNFKDIVEAQLTEAQNLSKAAVRPHDVYEQLVAKNYEPFKPPTPKPPEVQVANVPVNAKVDPIRGNSKKALVTIVEFSDFQCPFCARANGTVKQVLEKYGDDVRLVFKHQPLPFHSLADEAALAAIAAHKQGKFWQLHDLIFENPGAMKESTSDIDALMISYAKMLKLNVKTFERDYRAPKTKAVMDADIKLAAEVGARGTPTFFINGVKLVGAQPANKFEELIDEQLKLAKELKAKNKRLSGDALYKELVAHNIKQNKAAEKAQVEDAPKRDNGDPAEHLKQLYVGRSPVEGADKAPVTIYEFTDLQCPFCARASHTTDALLKKYKGKVRVVTKNNPLPFHKQAEPAARALMAAHKQGKAAEMRVKLFERSRDMANDPELFVKLANDIGLDAGAFERDMNSAEIAQQVKEDMEMGQKLGVKGTPTFFINGVKLVGAQPEAAFSTIIDEQLAATKAK